MAGVLAAVESPDGLFGVLGGCECEDGRTIAGWLVRFDAETGALQAHRLLDGDGPIAIEHGGAGLWSVGDGVLRRVDPSTLEDLVNVPVADAAASLAVGDDEVYVGNAYETTVQRIDAAGSVTATFKGKGPIIGSMSIAVGDAVWTIENGGIVELDAKSLAPIQRIAIPSTRGGELDTNRTTLWVYTESGLYSVEAERRTATMRLKLTGRHIGYVDANDGALWVTDYIGVALYRAELE